MRYLEMAATLAGVLYVVLAARENIWCWLPGLVNVLLTAIVCYLSALYADAALQMVYVALTFYGWHSWAGTTANTQQSTHLPISHITAQQALQYAVWGVVGVALLYYILQHYTPTNVPFTDAATTTLSLLATYATARKQLQNWLMWIVADIAYIGLYAYKQLPFFALLSVVYTVMAVYGYLHWQQKYRSQQSPIF